jgi:hypothetical protein
VTRLDRTARVVDVDADPVRIAGEAPGPLLVVTRKAVGVISETALFGRCE